MSRTLRKIALLTCAVWLGLGAAAPPALTPADEAAARAVLERSVDEGLAAVAVDGAGLAASLLAYAAAEHGQRAPVSKFPKEWAIRPPAYDASADFAAARSEGRVAAWIAGLAPRDPAYEALVGARRRYLKLARDGGWPSVAGAMRTGDQGQGVDTLRVRLRIEDPVAPASPPGTPYDEALADAVKRAQARLGLAIDGVVGRQTVEALNVTAAARAEQIGLNLERRRWMPRTVPTARAELNIADASLTVFTPPADPISMRVIVGQPDKQTPMFADTIRAVVLNPPWNVPEDIARKEIWPKIRKDPGYMAREGFVVKPDGGLQQRPGPKCALGAIKFDLGNPFGVYLHDTPARSLFAKPYRALSHGCMRVEQPNALAKRLLANNAKWQGDAVDMVLLTGRTERIALNPALPLYVAYWTAFVDADGSVQFRPDVYGWDSRLKALLQAEARPAA